MSIKIKPIGVVITDKFKYEIVATLVDRDDFLQDVAEIRKETPLSSYNEVQRIKQNREDIGYMREYLEQDHTVASLLKKYGKDYNFHEIIRFAVFAGIVTDQELNNFSYLFTVNAKSVAKLIELVGVDKILPITAIVVHPEAKESDVLQTFRNYQNTLKKQGVYIPDTISNIERDREWYWKHLPKEKGGSGLSYQVIWEQTDKDKRPSSRDGVIKAIKQYESRLTV